MKKIILFIALLMSVVSLSVEAQDNVGTAPMAPKTLFTYPQAPDTITNFEDRFNYVVIRFWNNFDLSKPIQDAAAFEGAFQDYISYFQHAHKTVVFNSIKNFMNKAQSNKANFMLIGRLAEKNLYSSQAVFASDEAYMPFVEAMLGSKILKKADKEYYKEQVRKINANAVGALCPQLDVVDVDGNKCKLVDLLGDKTSILFFNDGDCSDCVIDRLRLSTNVMMNRLITDGNVKLVCIVPKKYNKELAAEVKGWADNWNIVMSGDAENVFDLRLAPCVYLLDGEKKITDKNIPVNAIIR